MSTQHIAWHDSVREEGIIERVTRDGDGTWYGVTSNSGWTCGVSAEHGVEPCVGDSFVTWGEIGRPIRGQAINGRVLYYRTEDEQSDEDQKRADARQAEKIAKYEGARSQYDARVAALPSVLRQRVEGFRERGGDAWRWSHEPYELAVVEEAARLVERFASADEIVAFAALKPEQQRMVHPNMDDGHSGNTWGAALSLARLYHTQPELVPKQHAAFCPLMGCPQSHCWSTTQATSEGARDA